MSPSSMMYKVTCKTLSLFVLALVCMTTFVGCALFRPLDPIDSRLYASGTAYTYQPLNPTSVWIEDPTPEEEEKYGYKDADETSFKFNKALLRDLDTETVRIALNSFSGNANFNAGIVGISSKGQSYVLIVDYIKYITSSKLIDTKYIPTNAQELGVEKSFKGAVPIYTGIGLRIRAEFKALKSGLNIAGLPAIAVAASSNGVSGRLTVQTLGITGPEVTGLMPLISDISVASIQSAVQAVAAIKAKIYEESTVVYPKIVAFESPERDPALIRAITGFLYASKVCITPILIERPHDPKNEKIVWIKWFSCAKDDTEVIGFGEAKAISTIKTNMLKGGTKAQESFGKKSLGAIGDTVGNRFTFAFAATKGAKGVEGQMFLRDHDLNLTVSTEIVKLESHPKRRDVVGVKARGLNYIVRIRGPKGSAVVNGKPQPGWEVRAWMFDGDKDVVCITLKNPDGKTAYNWVGFLSAGDVKTK